MRIGGIDPTRYHYRDDFSRTLEEEVVKQGFSRIVDMEWLNYTTRSIERDGALVYVTLRWAIDHQRLIDRLDGIPWRSMRLHCEATETTNTIKFSHHIERDAMNGAVSRRAVQ